MNALSSRQNSICRIQYTALCKKYLFRYFCTWSCIEICTKELLVSFSQTVQKVLRTLKNVLCNVLAIFVHKILVQIYITKFSWYQNLQNILNQISVTSTNRNQTLLPLPCYLSFAYQHLAILIIVVGIIPLSAPLLLLLFLSPGNKAFEFYTLESFSEVFDYSVDNCIAFLHHLPFLY